MKHLKIAYSFDVQYYFVDSDREIVPVEQTDFTDVAVAVLSDQDYDYIDTIDATGFGIPIMVIMPSGEKLPSHYLDKVDMVLSEEMVNKSRCIETAERLASNYEQTVLPPFFGELVEYVSEKNNPFDCPGHQDGAFFKKHPAGRYLYDFFGSHIFQSDICNADVTLGDLLIHEGPALDSQDFAAKVFHADKTYFVLNGSSASNRVVTNALLTPGDLVLYDRNNHKSVAIGALIQAGATPVYLETARNPYGFIGGIDAHCFDETYLRQLAAERDPEKAKQPRPFRLAVIQLDTYDGTLYNARYVVDRIGHLCDYILFDSAWAGYEQFIPMLKDSSPLLLDLGKDDPGIFVVQSVHKQQAGFSQTSQIHKKDSHIHDQPRYVNHKTINNAFMAQATTSPFYPLFATLDVNAKIHAGDAGRKMWRDCVKMGIEARKDILRRCHYIRPFVAPVVHDRPWQKGNTEAMADDIDYFTFEPGARWHAFEGYGPNQYRVDPCKLLLTTPGIDAETGEYENFGIHANILATYLRGNGVIPEKCDLNSILFLLTPAENKNKLRFLTSQLVRFERFVDNNVPMQEVLLGVYNKYPGRYTGYTLRQLCQEMHDFFKDRNVKDLQKKLFRKEFFPEYVMRPQEAHYAFIRGERELVPLDEIEGRIALEGALPYPPGVLCVVPGERWSHTAVQYFKALEESLNELPGFALEIQGVYLEHEGDRIRAYGYVLKE
ncbi:ornithine decarboxylase [Megasphaera hexanoica]|uniref:Ornithine decarboxylase n=1 Tax=Megasphaera hexanoica TaxID=1675036 RepID=A0ABW7DLS1_9FIRM|nr:MULTISPECIES: ornithine decarboxylase [Megasphaera]AXB82891.1 ornithine decarboxylase [Megasphaera hexanoica]KUH57216.1 ornithine decarboxylase [Megasphaera sp. DJF_B143]HAM04686.1 ornithine decarboxylase [Megasphaera sp.]